MNIPPHPIVCSRCDKPACAWCENQPLCVGCLRVYDDSRKPSATLPDSGQRQAFTTGAVRDAMAGKGLPHMIPPVALRKIALRFEQGAAKYGPGNWMQGIPLSRYQDAIQRHTLAWAEGQTDEDHLGAVGWNFTAAAWTEQQIQAGRLPAALDDLPFRPHPLTLNPAL